MRLTDDGWKIEQYVLSLAVPNDLANPIARIIKAFEEADERAVAEMVRRDAEAVSRPPTP